MNLSACFWLNPALPEGCFGSEQVIDDRLQSTHAAGQPNSNLCGSGHARSHRVRVALTKPVILATGMGR
jgi:hypothetical protein